MSRTLSTPFRRSQMPSHAPRPPRVLQHGDQPLTTGRPAPAIRSERRFQAPLPVRTAEPHARQPRQTQHGPDARDGLPHVPHQQDRTAGKPSHHARLRRTRRRCACAVGASPAHEDDHPAPNASGGGSNLRRFQCQKLLHADGFIEYSMGKQPTHTPAAHLRQRMLETPIVAPTDRRLFSFSGVRFPPSSVLDRRRHALIVERDDSSRALKRLPISVTRGFGFVCLGSQG